MADPHRALALVRRSASGDTQMYRHENIPGRADRRTWGTMVRGTATLALLLFLPGLAAADPTARCDVDILKGEYVFTATGFTRAPGSPPGTPWVPKAIVEVLHFNGDGTLTTPALALANPFGDLGNVVVPPAGAPGEYSINPDCTGTVRFFDASGVTFFVYVDPPRGDTITMLQSNPANNVFQGSARRVW
jgi:hypothetical protein